MRFQFFDLALVGTHDGIAARIDDALKQLIDLAAHGHNLLTQVRSLPLHALGFRIPQIAKHLEREIEQPFRWAKLAEQLFKVALDHLTTDRLSRHRAAACVAKVVPVGRAAPFRPTGRQRLSAIAASDKAAQGKVLTEVLAHRSLRHAGMTLLHSQPGFEGDQRLMLRRNEVQTPLLVRHVCRVDRAREQFVDTLLMHFAVLVLRPSRLRFQEAFHLDNGFEASRGVAL